MSKEAKEISFEALAAEAGIDVAAAKEELSTLDATFGAQKGDIPAGALEAWTNAHFPAERMRKIAFAVGRVWESELGKKAAKK
jgi:hypothetical protein